MAGNISQIPVEQVHAFWRDVEEHLRTRHGLAGDGVLRAILRYRDEVERAGPLVYHRDPSEIGDDIISGGYATATPTIVVS